MKQAILEDLTLDELTRLIDKGDEVILNPKGKSMLPFIREGRDKVKLGRPEGLKKGDIVLAWFNGRYLLHRIYSLDGEKITMMGDGNLRGVEEILKSDVAGVVVEIIAPDGKGRKPSSGCIWRKLLPLRKYLLKVYRKWNRIRGKHIKTKKYEN